ncbi:MAG: hypothetical protein K0R59_89 [Sphingobacterium sp.]|jgi:hypothetical protein|nr:hypothetical protein [Sphingobacterium sp.]
MAKTPGDPNHRVFCLLSCPEDVDISVKPGSQSADTKTNYEKLKIDSGPVTASITASR